MAEAQSVVKSKPNRIWIELELPENDKQGEYIAEQACAVLKKMGIEYDTPVWWNPKKQRYCFTMDSGGSYVIADDNGHWYNLDYLAKHAGLKQKG